jgi:hypothetical protein
MRHCTTGQASVHDTGQAGRTAADPCVLSLAESTSDPLAYVTPYCSSDLQRGFFCLTKLSTESLAVFSSRVGASDSDAAARVFLSEHYNSFCFLVQKIV